MYKVIRYFENGKKKPLFKTTLEPIAQEHCNRPDTKGVTRNGVKWFDGYVKIK